MDYEKKYKNALTIAQSRFKIEKDESVLTCLGMMFPELRESEDERIRKKLYHTVLGTPNNSTWFDGTSKEAMLAWLEKQKESHIPWYDYQKSKEAGYTIVPNEEYEQLIKQKEQKPAWSEEDEFRLKEALEVLDESIRHLPIGYGYVTDVMNVTKWLKSLRPSWKPGEEQMDALKELIDDANRAGWVTPGATELYEQLKKL